MCQTRGTIAATMPDSKLAAQRRADRIAAFRAELDELEREGVAALSADERAAVARHHDALLRELAERFDVDVAEGERQLSLGMRIASLLGAAALAASAFLLFRRVWGLISTPAQVAVLLAAPVLSLLAAGYAARRERSGYFAALLGAVAVACFVLDLTMLGRIFNVAPSYAPFLAWSAFGLLLAYAYGLRLLLAAGSVAFALWLASWIVTWSGAPWQSLCARHLILAGVVELSLWRRPQDHAPVLRGWISRLAVERVHVPLRLRPVVDDYLGEYRVWRRDERAHPAAIPEEPPPHLRATIAVGRRHEPWLLDVRR